MDWVRWSRLALWALLAFGLLHLIQRLPVN